MVLYNSRSEPDTVPRTPSRPIIGNEYPTPQTGDRTRLRSPEVTTPTKLPSPVRPSARKTHSTATTVDESQEEFYDWPLSDDEELSKAVDQASSQSQNAMLAPETPRKAIKTDISSTPGKRRFDEIEHGGAASWPTPISDKKGDDIFTTPATGPGGKNLFSATGVEDTPTPVRFKDITPTTGHDSSLATEIINVLKTARVNLPNNAGDAIRDICNKQSLFTQGVIKGRDISRSLISKKDEKIVELQSSMEALQSERETSRAVIRHLRRELGVAKSNNRLPNDD